MEASGIGWFRVPAGAPMGDLREMGAWMLVLGNWHANRRVTVAQVRELTGWGAGKALAFLKDAEQWALSNGARCQVGQKADHRNETGMLPERKWNETGTSTPSAKLDNPSEAERERNESGMLSERNRNVSRARDSFVENRSEIGDPKPSPTPPAAHPESDLLPALAATGMNAGAASALARKLVDAGIYRLADCARLDDWEVGRITGIHGKVFLLRALEAAGVKLKSGRSQLPAMPSTGQAEEAWDRLVTMRRRGIQNKPESFTEAERRGLDKAGGWRQLGLLTEGYEVNQAKRRFIQAYNGGTQA